MQTFKVRNTNLPRGYDEYPILMINRFKINDRQVDLMLCLKLGGYFLCEYNGEINRIKHFIIYSQARFNYELAYMELYDLEAESNYKNRPLTFFYKRKRDDDDNNSNNNNKKGRLSSVYDTLS